MKGNERNEVFILDITAPVETVKCFEFLFCKQNMLYTLKKKIFPFFRNFQFLKLILPSIGKFYNYNLSNDYRLSNFYFTNKIITNNRKI